ncbi:MAG: hypothetical protein IJ071_10970 [Ruminococcus sp.]|nr:hypothetical protein [Ruminococcus sp.]
MKRLIAIGAAAMLLTGCGGYTSSQVSEIVQQATEDPFGSYYEFSAEGAAEEELAQAARIIEERAYLKAPGMRSMTEADPAKGTIRLYFKYEPRMEEFADTFGPEAAQNNRLEFCRGTEDTDPVLTNENVTSAIAGIMIQGGENWYVQVEFDQQGTQIFTELTTELAGTDTPISIWMDGELLSAPTVQTPITDGIAVISGDFTSESARALADRIGSDPMPCKVEYTGCSINK